MEEGRPRKARKVTRRYLDVVLGNWTFLIELFVRFCVFCGYQIHGKLTHDA
jgi:hypothetical protein